MSTGNFETMDEPTEDKIETGIWKKFVDLIVKLSEGQYNGSTNGNHNGCSGVGNCGNHSITIEGNQGTGSTYDHSYVGDYETKAFFAVTERGDVILGMDKNADPDAKAKFFYDNQVYMSPT